MDRFETPDDIIAFAIDRETEAYLFYYDLSNGAANTGLRDMLRAFAEEEKKHRDKLQALRDGRTATLFRDTVADLRIADYQVDIDPAAATDYQHILMLAMQKEKKAYRLYTDLAAAATDPAVADTMHSLAREEANHKLRLEIEYDDHVLTGN